MSSERNGQTRQNQGPLFRNKDATEYFGLLGWLSWINDSRNVEKKDALRRRIALLLGPVYKSTENNTKKSIKNTTRMVQKHREASEKNFMKQSSKADDHEDRWKLAVKAATGRTADWQVQARAARNKSIYQGRRGWETIKSLDSYYDTNYYRLVTAEHGPIDPWDAISEFVLGEGDD